MAVATFVHNQRADKAEREGWTEEQKYEIGAFAMLQIALCFICPPAAVFLERGLDVDFILALCLTCIVWLPGALYALYIVKKYELDPITPNSLSAPIRQGSGGGLTFTKIIASAKEEKRARYPPKQYAQSTAPSYRSRATAPRQYSSAEESSGPEMSEVKRGKQPEDEEYEMGFGAPKRRDSVLSQGW